MGSNSGKNGHAVLQAVLAEEYAIHAPTKEAETGLWCPYAGCPRPGHLAPDGETACAFHGAKWHGGIDHTWRPLPSGKQIRP